MPQQPKYNPTANECNLVSLDYKCQRKVQFCSDGDLAYRRLILGDSNFYIVFFF